VKDAERVERPMKVRNVVDDVVIADAIAFAIIIVDVVFPVVCGYCGRSLSSSRHVEYFVGRAVVSFAYFDELFEGARGVLRQEFGFHGTQTLIQSLQRR